MGSVFVASHPTLGRQAAVKFLSEELCARPELARRFLDEARVTAGLRHPNVIDIFDFGEIEGRLYYVMELLSGRDLAAAVKAEAPYSVGDTVARLIQICAGLQAAHAAGVVHRDLKPENVFVLQGDELHLKIMDFGVAKLLEATEVHTSYGQILGTPSHMAPEQAMGHNDEISASTDLYALGVIGYQMLTGEPVFSHSSPVTLLMMHINDPVRPIRELRADVDPAVASLIESCLAKRPEQRPQGARLLAEQLVEALRSAARPAPEVRATPLLPEPEALPRRIDQENSEQHTVNRLLARMKRSGDFPAFGQNLGEVSKRADFQSSYSSAQLGESILKDYALTAKLLRVVNLTYANRFGGKVYSVKHAIVILGFERVRSIALSIGVFKATGTRPTDERVADSAIASLVSGEIARSLAAAAGIDDPEQALVSAMFRNLGQHLVLVYLPELYDRIAKLRETKRLPLDAASQRVLGISVQKLGAMVAERWRLPVSVTGAMTAPALAGQRLMRQEDRVNALARFSGELCELVASEAPGARSAAANSLLARYRELLTLTEEEVAQLLVESSESFRKRYAGILGFDVKRSRLLRNAVAVEAQTERPAPVPGPAEIAHQPTGVDWAKAGPRVPAAKPAVARLDLVREVVPEGDSSLASALALASELLGVENLLVLRATSRADELCAVAGCGPEAEELVPILRLPLGAPRQATDVFSLAFYGNRDRTIKDAFSDFATARVPQRYYETVGAPAFALLACSGSGVPTSLLLVMVESADQLPSAQRVAELAQVRELIAKAPAAGTPPAGQRRAVP